MKKVSRRTQVEIAVVSIVLILCLFFTLPRFLYVQRTAEANRIQETVRSIAVELGRKSYKFPGLLEWADHPKHNDYVNIHARTEYFERIFKLESLIGITGVNALDENNERQYRVLFVCDWNDHSSQGSKSQADKIGRLIYYSVLTGIENLSVNNPDSLRDKTILPVVIKDETGRLDVNYSKKNLYHPSNGLDSGGLFFCDSIDVGWKSPAFNEPLRVSE